MPSYQLWTSSVEMFGSRARSEESRRSLTLSPSSAPATDGLNAWQSRSLALSVSLSLAIGSFGSNTWDRGEWSALSQICSSVRKREQRNDQKSFRTPAPQKTWPRRVADHRKFVRQSVIYCTKIGKINQPNIGLYVQGDPSGRGTLFFDIYLKVQPQYKVHIQI